MITPCCPIPTYLDSAITSLNPCPVDCGQIQKAIFWRQGNYLTVASALTATSWNTLLIATDDTKAIVTPFIHSFELPLPNAREHPETRDGATLRKGSHSTKIEKKFYAEDQDVIRSLKKLKCEALEVIFVNEAGQFIYSDREGDFRGFPIVSGSMFIGDKRLGGYSDWDSNKMIFNLEPSWSDSLEISESTTFALSLKNTALIYGNEPVVLPDGMAYLLCSNQLALSLKESVEFEFWFYFANKYNGAAQSLFEVQNNAANWLKLSINDNTQNLGITGKCNNVSYNKLWSGFFDTIPAWYKIKIVWTGTAFELFKNSVSYDTETFPDLNTMIQDAGCDIYVLNDSVGLTIQPNNKTFGFKYTTNAALIVHYPICEESGNTVYNVVSNAYHLTGQSGFSALTWSRDNDQEKYLKDYGYRLASGVYIPGLLDGSSAADGNPLTNISPNTEFN